MIPVTTLGADGKVNGYQAFNDNLTNVEQISRALLATLYSAQLKLTNIKALYDTNVGVDKYTDAELATMLTAANTLYNTVSSAIATFEATL